MRVDCPVGFGLDSGLEAHAARIQVKRNTGQRDFIKIRELAD
jgi:hypothetical protein